MIATAVQAITRVVGILCVAFALWLLAACLRVPRLDAAAVVLLIAFIPALVIGLSGCLMLLRKYRALAKLWINLVGGVMLIEAWSLPRVLGIDLRDPNMESPWTMLAWFAYFMFAIWVCQQFVLRGCEIVDRRWGASLKAKPNGEAEL
jgi:hypothetical protein